MLRSFAFGGAVLVAGMPAIRRVSICSLAQSLMPPKTEAPGAHRPTRSRATGRPTEKAIKAHAHYAAGVIHDINDEAELAPPRVLRGGSGRS